MPPGDESDLSSAKPQIVAPRFDSDVHLWDQPEKNGPKKKDRTLD